MHIDERERERERERAKGIPHLKMLNPNNFIMGEPNSQVLNSSLSSPSIVSEPPDIRNWFSSYTYQSPILDTNELFGNSVGVDEEERDLYVEDSENEEEDNWEDLTRVRKSHQSAICDQTTRPIERKSGEGARTNGHNLSPVEVPVYPDSLSLPSEPPDIKNWFSSYVYESPTLDSSDFDISLLSNNDFRNIQESDKAISQSSKCKETNSIKSARPIGIDSNETHPASQEKEGSENIDSDEGSHEAALRSTDIITYKPDEFPKAKDECPLPILLDEKQTIGVENTQKDEVKAENDSGWILPNSKSRKALSESMKKEDEKLLGKENPRTNEVNCGTQLGCNKSNYVTNVRREALKETTNLYHSSTMEVAGKWKCPQKRRPNTGPPLKQLRLERWVHRI